MCTSLNIVLALKVTVKVCLLRVRIDTASPLLQSCHFKDFFLVKISNLHYMYDLENNGINRPQFDKYHMIMLFLYQHDIPIVTSYSVTISRGQI